MYLVPLLVSTYVICNVLNALCDYESKIDEKDTSSDRTMFDYGLTKVDVWNIVYFTMAAMVGATVMAFSHFTPMDQLWMLMYTGAIILLAVYYNLPPLRLKTKFFGAEATIFLIFAIQVNTAYSLVVGKPSYSICFTDYPGCFLKIWAIMMNLYVDSEEDKKDSSKSIPIVLGDKIARNLIIFTSIMVSLLTIKYAIQHNNIYVCLSLLSIPLKFTAMRLAFRKQKNVKPLYFKSMLIYNVFFSLGIIINKTLVGQ
ncbi:hypothetical protein CYY_008013 [Polysphondylium violaceum]|uniref:UbiA prenyltransferase family protein n=1 Tax=Polysphondylium violaceum TaxID=133409 RepID=A0A8J4PNJ0_9MYCE|nr:hypothetical protein CYY_008013 [Polysphondylium violaceum]